MYNNILVPLAPDHEAVAKKSIEVARALLAQGGKITILTVIEAIPSYVAQYLPRDQAEKNRRDMASALEAEFTEQPDVSVVVHDGHAAQSILDVAEHGGHDCIVIASHKPGMQDYLLGSTAARVVRHAQCGVHVLR